MEWEVQLIEWIQSNLGSFTSALGKIFSFFGGEKGLLLVFLIVLVLLEKRIGEEDSTHCFSSKCLGSYDKGYRTASASIYGIPRQGESPGFGRV